MLEPDMVFLIFIYAGGQKNAFSAFDGRRPGDGRSRQTLETCPPCWAVPPALQAGFYRLSKKYSGSTRPGHILPVVLAFQPPAPPARKTPLRLISRIQIGYATRNIR